MGLPLFYTSEVFMNQFKPSTEILLGSILLITVTVLLGMMLNRVMVKKGFKSSLAIIIPIMVIISSILILRFGLTATTIQGLFLTLILLYASFSDLTNHEADDFLWVIVLALSLCSINTVGLISMVLGALFVIIPQLAMAILPPHKTLGGADIKLSTALAFLLGTWRGLGAYLIGLVIAVIYMAIYNKLKNRDGKEPFALIPFLSMGAIAMFII